MLGRILWQVADTDGAVINLRCRLAELIENFDVVIGQDCGVVLTSRFNDTHRLHERVTQSTNHRQLAFVHDALPAPRKTRKQIRNLVVVDSDEVNYAGLGLHESVQNAHDVAAHPSEFRPQQIDGLFLIDFAAGNITTMLFAGNPGGPEYRSDGADRLDPRCEVFGLPSPCRSSKRRRGESNQHNGDKAENYFRPLPDSFQLLSPIFEES